VRTPMSARTVGCVRLDMGVRADTPLRPRERIVASARTHGQVRADAPCFIPGNFKKDAIVRLSHGRPRGHRLIVRPSVHPRTSA
jgi:hypothetical protein